MAKQKRYSQGSDEQRSTEHVRPQPGRTQAHAHSGSTESTGAEPSSGVFAVVALGASYSRLAALEEFFAAAPVKAELAFVVIQHLDREDAGPVTEALSRCTQMPVREAADGEPLKPNHVFVIPSNMVFVVSSGVFVEPPADERGLPIDTFLRSLSQEHGELAAGVLLGGTGSDGMLGLRAIKEQGGLALARATETAEQLSASADLVDDFLPPRAMPARVLEHAARRRSARSAVANLEIAVSESLPMVCNLVRSSTGHDFSRYKEGTLNRRVRRRMQLLRLDSVPAYLERLEKDAQEAGLLLKDLLIRVTQFFREPGAFEVLSEKVITKLLEDESDAKPIRIWVAGCATGEEVYSIAILLHERFAARKTARPVQLFATDIDPEALATARAGRYDADIAEQVSAERLARFFVPADYGYQVVKELRDMCIFSIHNLIRDPPFSSLDLISCRNVLIYLEPELQKKVVPLLHYALRCSGFLFLGSSEELTRHSDLFLPIDKKQRIFQRKETLVRPTLDFPLSGTRTSPSVPVPASIEPSVRNTKQAVLQAFERMLAAEFAPASAVVDERGEILCLGGKRGHLLQPPSGLATSNLLDYADGRLRHALRTALAQVSSKRTEVVVPEFVAEVAGGRRRLRVTARPAPQAPAQAGLYAIVVEDLGATRVSKAEASEALSPEPMLEQLESELKTTRADLQAANEELESTNEELKSSNEELISTNEELQSANEELQTSKEELQSVNEELETVNCELREKVTELRIANSDLQNLFASTQVATVFLSRELKLAKFTPAANKLFGFVDADIGRPLTDLAQRFAGTDLLADVSEVLRTLVPVEREIRAGEPWFILRVMPYRTLDDAIAGAVITFADVTKLKRAESSTRESERLLKDVIDGSPFPIFLKDLQGRFLTINKSLEKLVGTTREALRGKTDYDLFPREVAEYYRESDRKVAETRQAIDVEEVAELRDGHHVFLNSKFPLFDASGLIYGVGVISHDITERKRTEELVRRYAGLLRLSHDAIFVRKVDGEIEFWNDGAEKLYGFTELEALGRNVHELLNTSPVSTWHELSAVLTKQGHWEGELQHRTKGGQRVTVTARMQLLHGEDGIERILQSNHDISERKRMEEDLRESEERYRALFECASDAILVTDPEPPGPVLSANAAACRMFGCSAEEILKLNRDALTEPAETQLQAALAGREVGVAKAEVTYRRRDGSRFPVEVTSAFFMDRHGRRRTVAIIRDITERKRAEADLMRSRQGLKHLAEASVRVMRETELGPMFRCIAEAALELTGGRLAIAGHGGKTGPFIIDGSARVSGAPDCPPGEVFCVEKGGFYLPLMEGIADTLRLSEAEMHADPRWRARSAEHSMLRGLLGVRLVDRQGRVGGMLLVTDKSHGDFSGDDESLLRQLGTLASLAVQHVEARISLEAADSRKNEFLASLSHELRNPLAPIKNSLYILEHSTPDGERGSHAQSVISRQVAHLVRLVDDLLDVTRITRGKIRLKRQRLELGAIVKSTVEDYRAMFTEAGIELTQSFEGELWVDGDKTRISQIVGNLLNNALKFTPRGGSVSVLVQGSEDAKAMIKVQDSGVGISAELLPCLFDPFIQADRTLDRTAGGLGLGLALVKGLVEQHGGSVAAHSEGPGKGSRLEVLLPTLAEPPQAIPVPAASHAFPSAARRVLIIEDNRDAADSLRDVLELGNHVATVAYTAEEGMESARALRPDFVICDIGLPGTDGYEVARALRADPRLASTTLIALTGYAAVEDVARAHAAGFDHHLAKPPRIEALEQILRRRAEDES